MSKVGRNYNGKITSKYVIARKDEIQKILQYAGHSACLSNPKPHLSNWFSLANYIRIADEISIRTPKTRILDWGCGYGQMIYLLQNREMEVFGLDLVKNNPVQNLLLDSLNVPVIITTEEVHIPYEDSFFDAVLSCGVLEHVKNVYASLREIRRILKPGGIFYIYFLPNKYSLVEYLSQRIGRWHHQRIYSKNSIQRILTEEGFCIRLIRNFGILPKNLAVFPTIVLRVIKLFYNVGYPLWLSVDKVLSNLPIVKNLSATIEVLAQKSAT